MRRLPITVLSPVMEAAHHVHARAKTKDCADAAPLTIHAIETTSWLYPGGSLRPTYVDACAREYTDPASGCDARGVVAAPRTVVVQTPPSRRPRPCVR